MKVRDKIGLIEVSYDKENFKAKRLVNETKEIGKTRTDVQS